jgi:hypothetical protein
MNWSEPVCLLTRLADREKEGSKNKFWWRRAVRLDLQA